MIKAIISDSSKTLIFPVDQTVTGSINKYYLSMKEKPDFDVYDYFKLNDDLLEALKDLEVDKYVFTTGLHIQNDPEIAKQYAEVFDKVFTEEFADNYKKKDSKSFQTIAKKLNLNPDEILYLDDKQENIDAANQAGYTTILINDNRSAIEAIKRLF